MLLQADSGEYYEVYCRNNDAGAQALKGDAAKDETKFFWRVHKRRR
jgi:hypothetical protein